VPFVTLIGVLVAGLVAQPPAPSFVQEIPPWYFLFQLVNALLQPFERE